MLIFAILNHPRSFWFIFPILVFFYFVISLPHVEGNFRHVTENEPKYYDLVPLKLFHHVSPAIT